MESTQEAIESRLCEFFMADLEWQGDAAALVGDHPLAIPELLDSEEILELVTFLEEEYAIEIDDDEITPDNFKTLPDVARMVRAKLTEGA